MPDGAVEPIAAALFAVALIHTFAAKRFERLSHRFARHAGLFHLLGEVEVVFGFWAIALIAAIAAVAGGDAALRYAESRDYAEPLFVFVVMVVAGSRPVLQLVQSGVEAVARRLPMRRALARAWLALAAVPLLGSLVTEPAAMTIAALMLSRQVFAAGPPERLKYLVAGVLFVNVSIGGTLTAYAAPPVLMVADAWGWGGAFMLSTFGWKAAIAVVVNASLAALALRRHLPAAAVDDAAGVPPPDVPWPSVVVHLALLAGIVAASHHPVAFLALFLLFLGLAQAYERHHDALLIKEALLVAFFLAGLVVLGGLQRWWLEPLIDGLQPLALFLGALGMTAVVDNAALTYLGSLLPSLADDAKFALVAGAVAGGGLTVIANAPNPAGIALLRRDFADRTVGAGGLFLGALAPTAIAAAALWVLP